MLDPGTRLGSYEIVSPLGAGGMGEVYRATDAKLGREVAIKVLPSHLAQDPDALARFEREARAVAALSHPNILGIFDFGDHDGLVYAVTELLEGHTLRAELADGPLTVRQTIDYGRQIAHGLAAAHDKGIVHRDLKPENVFITRDGRVKILDFGVAKVAGVTAGADQEGLTTRMSAGHTTPGMVLGTIGYMAPEQVRGLHLDHRADLFSFGVILFEMVTGRRPFERTTMADTMTAILKEDPPEGALAERKVPPVLERVIRHALEKRPDERFQSARDLAFGLGALSTTTEAAQPGAPGRVLSSRGHRLRVIATVVGVAAVGGGLFLAGRLTSDAGAGAPPVFERLTFRRGNILHGAFAPDGQTVVYAAAYENQPAEIFVTRLDSRESRPLGIRNADVLAVSAGGELAVLLKQGGLATTVGVGTLARVPLGGGTPREILENVTDADWSPDGRDLAVSALVGTEWQIQYPLGQVIYRSPRSMYSVRISPDGERIAFFQDEGSGYGTVALSVVDRAGTLRVLAERVATNGGWIAWSADGRQLFYTGGVSLRDIGVRATSLDGRDRLVLQGPDGLLVHGVTGDGRLLVEREAPRVGIMASVKGSRERETAWLDVALLADLAADGALVLMTEMAEDGTTQVVFLRRTDGSPPVRLADGTGMALSPDGRTALVLADNPADGFRLVPTGAGQPRHLPTAPVVPAPFAVSASFTTGARFLPDGQHIVFLGREPDTGNRLYALDVAGAAPRPITPEGIGYGFVVSPDGRDAAFTAGDGSLAVAPIAGGNVRRVAALQPTEALIQWSADGRSIFTARVGELPVTVERLELATGRRLPWKTLMPTDAGGLIRIDRIAISPDATSYAYSYVRMVGSDLYVVSGVR